MPKEPNFSLKMKGERKAVLEIYDEIGPEWAGMIGPSLISKAINESGPLDSIEVRINSPGGSVFHGVAIYNILKNHPAKIHMRVDGVAASSASVVLMAGDTIEVPKNALVMIHDPEGVARGRAAEMLKSAEFLEKVKSQIVDTYASRTGKAPDVITQMMSDETWMTGDEAVTHGFASRAADEIPIMAVTSVVTNLSNFTYSRAPENFGSLYSLAMCATRKEPETMADTNTPEMIATEEARKIADSVKAAADAAKALADKQAADIANAVDAERKRSADIMAVCNQAGKPDLAAEFISNKTTLADVQARLFTLMCNERKPADDAGSERQSGEADPNAAYKAEYAKQAAAYAKNGVSEADYVATRRIDDGLDPLQKLG